MVGVDGQILNLLYKSIIELPIPPHKDDPILQPLLLELLLNLDIIAHLLGLLADDHNRVFVGFDVLDEFVLVGYLLDLEVADGLLYPFGHFGQIVHFLLLLV